MSMLQRRMQPDGNMPARRVGIGSRNVLETARRMNRSNENLETLLAQIQSDESSKLYPRLALFEGLSDCKDKPVLRDQTTDTTCNLRRDFLDSFAYLCDFRKGGSTVTASALEETSGKVYLWLAANEGISPAVLMYAKRLLRNLKRVTSENWSTKEHKILKLAIEKSEPRLVFYRSEVKKYTARCSKALRHRVQSDTGTKLTKLW
jgi:hypothetical protein